MRAAIVSLYESVLCLKFERQEHFALIHSKIHKIKLNFNFLLINLNFMIFKYVGYF